MELTDIMSKEEWIKFEKHLSDRFKINCTVYNAKGFSITGIPNWCNNLCPAIKANKSSLMSICAPGNQYFMSQAKKTQEAVIGECDAGLCKIAVPIFSGEEFLGTAGGCGLLFEDGEVESFMINKSSGMEEKKIAELSEGINTMAESEAKTMAEYINKKISEMIKS